jgi:hypothetical protein
MDWQNPSDVINYLSNFIQDNIYILSILGSILLAIYVIRHLPDKVNIMFWLKGIWAGKKADEHRKELAEIIAQESSNAQKAIANQALRIQQMNFERDRIKHLVQTHPKLVKEVGLALESVEREYLNSLKVIKSEQAKEVLRLATEQRIRSVLSSLDIPDNVNLPSFKMGEKQP